MLDELSKSLRRIHLYFLSTQETQIKLARFFILDTLVISKLDFDSNSLVICQILARHLDDVLAVDDWPNERFNNRTPIGTPGSGLQARTLRNAGRRGTPEGVRRGAGSRKNLFSCRSLEPGAWSLLPF